MSSWLKGLKQHEISAEITRGECILSGQPARLAVICAAKPCQTWLATVALGRAIQPWGKRHIANAHHFKQHFSISRQVLIY
ncbi:hypothetical protein [Pelomonas sp. Root1237]|uniref:hypothetical protein n=1 Tax=Pelomonas sp. Root1237 TaxID=1736434 RepID=UPI0012FB48CD|nr:hypothetical protein [Pelomonas sp. Root1237]